MIKHLELDLSKLQQHAGKLMPGVDLEHKLVELYKLVYFNEEPLEPFTQFVLSTIYQDFDQNIKHEYDEILIYYKEKYFITVVFEFLSLIEHIVLNKIDEIDIINLYFSKWIDKKSYKVLFEYEVVDEIFRE